MKFQKNISRFFAVYLLLLFLQISISYSQAVPGKDENIPFLVTFGKDGQTSWGDNDFNQIWFFTINRDYTQQFYIRVFDPDTGGENDEMKTGANTRCLYSIYGGNGVDPDKNEASKGLQKNLDFKTGNLLASKIFGAERDYDNKYYTFGPFNPSEGDFNQKWNAYVFKIVCEGISGDDGNLYRYFLSRSPDSDVEIEGANAFTYEYTFRLWNNFKSVSHIYPYVDTGIVLIRHRNFDWDGDGRIIVASRYRQGKPQPISNEDDWIESRIFIEPMEVGSSLDFQFHKKQEEEGGLVRNNNVVVTLENQRGDALKFYSSPIGGVPVYTPRIVALPAKKNNQPK